MLGRLGGSPEEEAPPNRVATSTPTATATASATRTPRPRRPAAPARVSLRLTATDVVYVCVEDASGKAVVDGETLAAGTRTRTFRSRRFRANFGNGGVRMTIDGKPFTVADIGRPVGYDLRPGKRPRRLSESVRVGLCST